MPVQALAEGGYGRASIPSGPSAASLATYRQGNTAPNVEQLRRTADVADRAQLQRAQAGEAQQLLRFSEDPNNPHGVSGVFQGAREMGNQLQNSMPGSVANDWRLQFQAMKNRGVDRLQTGAAASAKQGGGVDRRQVVDYQSQLRGGPQVTGYTQGANLGDGPGFYDRTPSLAQLYQANPNMTMDQMNPRSQYEENALNQLRNWRLR